MIDSLKLYVVDSQWLSNNERLYFLKSEAREQENIAAIVKANQGVLLTEWVCPHNSTHTNWFVLYLLPSVGLCCVQSILKAGHTLLVDLSQHFPVCNRLQRSIYELTRIPTKHAKDKRPWLNHGHFPVGILNSSVRPKPVAHPHYPFKKVSGDGVHEIAVGPVHAGIIEPGHFRFSVVGERILKMEERFGYTHKGIHQLLKNKSIEMAAQFIGRVSGDSTVAYACAFAKACEYHRGVIAGERIRIERALCLERERLCNHIGDIGAIVNDAGMPSLQSSFSCLKEDLLRHNADYFGHRYLMDVIKPFSDQAMLSSNYFASVREELARVENKLLSLQKMADYHFGLQDRLQGSGVLLQEQAQKLGVVGLVAKASGIDYDLRRLFPDIHFNSSLITLCHEKAGDVAARVTIRFKECFESINLIRELISKATEAKQNPSAFSNAMNMGIGVVEGWRGPVTIVISLNEGEVDWCHFHDPSWQNWLGLELALLDNIVADFPLINKSFNLSYSGQDS